MLTHFLTIISARLEKMNHFGFVGFMEMLSLCFEHLRSAPMETPNLIPAESVSSSAFSVQDAVGIKYR